jgi:hypothetical protein
MTPNHPGPRFLSTPTDVTFQAIANEPKAGLKRVHLVLGPEGDSNAPHIFWAQDAPGLTWDPMSHPSDFLGVYLAGSQKVGDRWYHAGDARFVPAGQVYGPTEPGPEGSTMLIIFRNSNFGSVPEGSDVASSNPYINLVHARGK